MKRPVLLPGALTRALVRVVSAALAVVAVSALAACPTKVAAGKTPLAPDPEPPHFYADPPFGVGFQCVTLGCDEEKTLVIENRGGGKLGISKVRLSVDSSGDFALRRKDGAPLPTPDAQVFLAAAEKLELVIRYRPSDGALDAGKVEMEHYDAVKAYNDSAPKTDGVPLTARAFGSPAATLPTEVVDFGYVVVGQEKSIDLIVGNTGEAEVLSVGPARREDGSSPVFHATSPRDWGVRFANPGESAHIPIVFSPTVESAYFGAVVLTTNDPLRPGIRVVVQGTAIADARLAVIDPAGDVVMPPMRSGESRTRTVTVQNLGGAPLDFAASISEGAELGLTVDPPRATSLAPLATVTLAVTLAAQAGGAVDGTLELAPTGAVDDAGVANVNAAVTDVHVHADVDAPELDVSPFIIDFGDVVQGWTAPAQQLAFRNTGFGELTITSVAFELGSSSEITLVDVPTLPLKLAPGADPVFVTVLMQAANIGPADAVLLVITDSIDGEVRRVDLHGDIITCDEGCPTPHGTPSCDSGFCDVGSCVPGFHNPDGVASNGCECGEDPGGDDPASCAPRGELGSYDDCGGAPDGRDVFGTLSEMDDIDLYHFDVNDTSSFPSCDVTSDSSQTSAELVSAPTGLALCANIQGGGTGCGGNLGVFDPGLCRVFTGAPVDFHHCGSFGGDDNRSMTFSLMWAPGAQPQCGAYHVVVRGRHDHLCN